MNTEELHENCKPIDWVSISTYAREEGKDACRQVVVVSIDGQKYKHEGWAPE